MFGQKSKMGAFITRSWLEKQHNILKKTDDCGITQDSDHNHNDLTLFSNFKTQYKKIINLIASNWYVTQRQKTCFDGKKMFWMKYFGSRDIHFCFNESFINK